MRKRIQWIDISRGIAILAVVIGHTLGPYTGNFWGSFIFAFHMPIFFVLSGYLYHERKIIVELKNGFLNLLLPYIATAVIVVLLSLLASTIRGNTIIQPYFKTSTDALISVLYGSGSAATYPADWKIQPIGALWFLLAMFIAIQLFNSVMIATSKMKYHMFIRTLCFAMFAILGAYLGKLVYLPWAFNAALFSQAFLYAGYLIRQYNFLDKLPQQGYIFCGGVWLLSAFFGYFNLNVPNSPNLLISFLGGIGASLCIFKFSQWLEQKNSDNTILALLMRYGRLSLIVLCFHLVDLNVIGLESTLYKIVLPFAGNFVAAIISILYRIIFVTIFIYLVPKIPGLRSFYLSRQFPMFGQKRKSVSI